MPQDLSAQEFYHLRDDRTNRLTESHNYHRLSVRLISGISTIQSFTGQVQLLTAANMLVRWCRQIEFGFPDAPLVKQLQLQGYHTLHQRIKAEVKQADPFGHFVFRERRSKDIQYTLKVGSDHLAEPVDFTIDSNGWEVWAGEGNRAFEVPQTQSNPAGPAFAACIGVADAFKVATGLPRTNRVENFHWSMFNFDRPNTAGVTCPTQVPSRLALGNVQIVGVGSVGSAVIYLLAMTPLEGVVHFIDHDIVKIENLNRSPLFGVSDIGTLKVRVAARYLQSMVSVITFEGRYDQFIERHGREPNDVDLILPLANEFGVRTCIEHNLPPLQIYGTTTPDWGLNYHRHIPLQEDCSLCRFPADAQQASFVCSEAQVQAQQGERIDAALPFLSMGAAALTVADLLKLHLPGYPFTSNFAFVDFKGKLEAPYPLVHTKLRRPECMCTKRSVRIHQNYLASTRFSSFSITDPITDAMEGIQGNM